ncbi:MAG: ATP-dependent zinc metalloprotease FtsH [Clostridiales bacterium]|nr:ATP-dependent zinc metalloprotease FtsH [Clostridiales bacterium]
MIITLLLNAFLFPRILEAQVTEVTYNDFLDKLDAGKVDEVAIDDSQIIFTAQGDNGNLAIYKTGRMPDDDLVTRLRAAKGLNGSVQFASEIPTQQSPILSFLISWVFPILLFTALGSFMVKRMGGAAGNAMQFGKSNAKIYIESQTGKTFADVEGEDEAKDALREVVDFLHNPDKYTKIGAKMPKGVLLVGPPGTGKTLLAKAVAGEAKVPFFSISGSEFVEMFVGMGAAKVRDLFKQANEKAPCIVFIDEIDTIGKRRDSGVAGGGNDEREQTLNQLLTEMDGFDGTKGVVILAATNRPESLDKALLRPGRFDRRVPVELPDQRGRVAILKIYMNKVKHDDNIDLELIGRSTSGASGAELANIVNEAALRAVRQGRDSVNQGDLEESVETVIAGYQRKGSVITEKEKRVIAYHEIGHALVAARQKGSAPVQKITIIPRTSGALGYTMQVESEERVLMTREDAMNQLEVLTGGRTAEEVVFGSITTGASNDIEKATQLARGMVTKYGMSSQFDMVSLEVTQNQYLGGESQLTCSAETAARVDAEVNDLIKSAHDKAREVLTKDRHTMDVLAGFLLERETITGAEFMDLLGKVDSGKA